jgi:hypothetical protein
LVISHGLYISLYLFLHEYHTYPETVSIPLTCLTILTLVHYMSVLSISFCFWLLSVLLCLRGEGGYCFRKPIFSDFYYSVQVSASCTVEYSIFVGKHVQSSWVKRSTYLRTQLSTIIIFINGNHAKNYTSSILYCLFWKHKSRIQEPTDLPLWAIDGNSGPRIYVLSQ